MPQNPSNVSCQCVPWCWFHNICFDQEQRERSVPNSEEYVIVEQSASVVNIEGLWGNQHKAKQLALASHTSITLSNTKRDQYLIKTN